MNTKRINVLLRNVRDNYRKMWRKLNTYYMLQDRETEAARELAADAHRHKSNAESTLNEIRELVNEERSDEH